MGLPDTVAEQLRLMGPTLGPDMVEATRSLFAALPRPAAAGQPRYDLAYGPHPRQRMDLYRPEGAPGRLPVLVYVPGGGFTGGDKRADAVFYGNVGRFAAAHGMLGVVLNYRLAPDAPWPAGAEDVRAAIGVLQADAAALGLDPDRIAVMGQSAGATHVATALTHPALGPPLVLRAAVLVNGLLEMTAALRAPNLRAYFGADDAALADRSPLTHAGAGSVPTMIALSELDPPFLARTTLRYAAALTERDGRVPPFALLPGHNHVSCVMALGTSDATLAAPLLRFLAARGVHA
jgi:triacylglycerol lipase